MKAIILIISCLVWMLIFSAVAFSETRVNFLLVRTEYKDPRGFKIMMSIARQKRMARQLVQRARGRRIPLKLGKIIVISDIIPEIRPSGDLNIIFNEFSSYYHYSLDKGFVKPNQVFHVMTPPHIIDGHRYLGGVALQCSVKKGGFSYSNAVEWNTYGFTRYAHSLNAALHEILHTVGADHDNSNHNVMHEDASRKVEDYIEQGRYPLYPDDARLPINLLAYKQVRGCLGN